MSKKFIRKALKTLLSFIISFFVVFHPWKNEKTHIFKKNTEVENVKLRPWYFKGGSLLPRPGGERLKLWPQETQGDRILNQLMFVPEKEPPSKKKIYLRQLQNIKYEKGSQIFYDFNCPVKNCEVVFNQTLADAVVFENFVSKIKKKSFDQIWILHSLESPFFSGKVIQQKSVNWTASYRSDSDIVTPYEKWVYYDQNKKVGALLKNYARGKTKKVIWFVSNCRSKNKRLEYAKTLRKYIPVDIYGECGERVCSKKFGERCRKIIAKKYKFYLSFENANCRDYITEKFYWNALKLDLIPVVMGAPRKDYEKVAPLNSFIHVEDFASPKHLANYLHRLDKNDEEYNSYFLWKSTGEFINTYFLCRLCSMLHAQRTNYFYQNIGRWWRRPGICTESFWNSTNRKSIMRSLKTL